MKRFGGFDAEFSQEFAVKQNVFLLTYTSKGEKTEPAVAEAMKTDFVQAML